MFPRLQVITLWLVVMLLIAGCEEPEAQVELIRPVRALKIGDLKAMQGREFTGRASAKDEVDLSFQVAGPLTTLLVDVGSEVQKGDIIATIDSRDFEAALESATSNLERAKSNLLAMERGARPEEIEQLKAAVAQAEASHKQAVAEYERNAPLVKDGYITQAEIDIDIARAERSTAEVKKAKEELNIGLAGARPEDLAAKRSEIRALEANEATARNQLDYSVLKAPFDGTVAARYVDNFQTVQAKQPVIRLLNVSRIQITIQVPESLMSLIPLVESVDCHFDAFPDREFVGKVTKIGREASQTTRTFPVTVEIDQPEDIQILPGMAATVRNRAETAGQSGPVDLVVPASAVFGGEEAQKSFVWVMDKDRSMVSRRSVTLGKLTPVGFSITEGLQPGEWVVWAGVNSLREGQEVKLLEEGKS